MLLPRALKGADLVLYSVFKSLGIQINVVPVIMEDDYKEEDYDDYEEDNSEQPEKGEQQQSEKGEQRHPKWNISLLTNSSARWTQATSIRCL